MEHGSVRAAVVLAICLLLACSCAPWAAAAPGGDPRQWRAREVVAWMRGISTSLGQYHLGVLRHGIDGAALLSPHMSDEAWLEVGITAAEHRRTLMAALHQLRQDHPAALPPSAWAVLPDGAPTGAGAANAAALPHAPVLSFATPTATPAAERHGQAASQYMLQQVGGSGSGNGAAQRQEPLQHAGRGSQRALPHLPSALSMRPAAHDSVQASPEAPGTGWAVVPGGRGGPSDPVGEFPPHSEADELRWPIGVTGQGFYRWVRNVHTMRGQPWGVWRQTRGAHLSEAEAVRQFLDLGDPHKTGLAVARQVAEAEMEANGYTMQLPDVVRASPHNRTSRGTALVVNGNKLVHDRDQLQHLINMGRVPPAFQESVDNLTRVYAEAAVKQPDQFFLVAPPGVDSVGRTLQRLLYVPPDPPPRLLEENLRFPLNLEKDWSAIEQEYFAQDPGIVVVDDFLTQEALENIRNLCLESTTFWDVRSTYMGSYVDDGLGNHVLFRVIEELRRAMPNLIGDMDLQTMWSYKYFDNQVGIKKHCDDADLNINFWVTPDDANLDPDTGGLVVYRAQPTSNWTFDDFQLQPQSQINLERLLAESDAGYVRVPHRANRIVIFNSTLVHETDSFTFKTGYKNRRINFTFLFGQRKWAGRPDTPPAAPSAAT